MAGSPQPLSFDLSTNDHIRDKAAKWAEHLLGLNGADEAFIAHFIVRPPSNPAMRDAFERALDLLRLPAPSAEVVYESVAEALVDWIVAEVQSHEGAT